MNQEVPLPPTQQVAKSNLVKQPSASRPRPSTASHSPPKTHPPAPKPLFPAPLPQVWLPQYKPPAAAAGALFLNSQPPAHTQGHYSAKRRSQAPAPRASRKKANINVPSASAAGSVLPEQTEALLVDLN